MFGLLLVVVLLLMYSVHLTLFPPLEIARPERHFLLAWGVRRVGGWAVIPTVAILVAIPLRLVAATPILRGVCRGLVVRTPRACGIGELVAQRGLKSGLIEEVAAERAACIG